MARTNIVLLALTAAAAAASWATGEEQQWQSDVTDSMGIGPSVTGYRRVALRCAADHMQVDVEMEDDFDGVLYTRGAFYSQKAPCFLDATGGRNFTLRLPFTQCNTHNEDNLYSNTIVVQYDDELIMPGDAAFKLECNFQKPRDYTVSSDLTTYSGPILSQISLEDADPAAQDRQKGESLRVSSDSSTVSFTPDSAKILTKDEL